MSRFVHFWFAVYLLSDQSSARPQPMRVVAESLRNHPNLSLVSELPKEPQTPVVDAS
jgi:hypothetical protein